MSRLKISVEQLQQLIAWAGTEPHTEVTIERTVGDEGPGLYAFNSDHPEEGAIRLDACLGVDAELAERQTAARMLVEMMSGDEGSDGFDALPAPASGTPL